MTRKHPAQELEEDVLVRTSNMGQGRSDYEAFHTLSPAIHLREIHTHDFFELYIHLNPACMWTTKSSRSSAAA